MEPYSNDDIKRKKRKYGYILNRLLGAAPEIISAAIVSAEGFPIASTLPQGVDEARIAAMTAALLSLSERAIIEMRKGDLDHLYIKGSEGYLFVMQAGPNAVLIASTTHSDILLKREIKIKIESIADDFLKKLLGTIPEVKFAAIVSAEGLLKKLLAAIPEVKATAIISAEGLPIASALPQDVDETRIAAMTVALLSLSERAIIEMKKGDFDQLFIKGSEGYLLVRETASPLMDAFERDGVFRNAELRFRALRELRELFQRPRHLMSNFKIVIFGDANVGKNSISGDSITNFGESNSNLTIGVNFAVKTMSVNNRRIRLQILRITSEPHFRFSVPNYFHGANGGLFIYDITNYSSLTNLVEWMVAIQTRFREEDIFPIIVVGNKTDLSNKREVPMEEAIKFAKSIGVASYIECSFKTGKNVEKMFERLVRLMLKKEKERSVIDSSSNLNNRFYYLNMG